MRSFDYGTPTPRRRRTVGRPSTSPVSSVATKILPQEVGLPASRDTLKHREGADVFRKRWNLLRPARQPITVAGADLHIRLLHIHDDFVESRFLLVIRAVRQQVLAVQLLANIRHGPFECLLRQKAVLATAGILCVNR